MKTIRFKAVGPRQHPKLRPTRAELSRIHLGLGEYTAGGQVYAVYVGDACTRDTLGSLVGYVKKFKGKWAAAATWRWLWRWLAFDTSGWRAESVTPQKTRRAAAEGLVP